MATYVLPQVQIFQEFTQRTSPTSRTLSAHIAGGNAYLARYSKASEKEQGFLGYYDDTVETCYAWPNLPLGGVVDPSYTQLWIENGLLLYFQDLAGGGYGSQQKVSGYSNRVISSAVNFVANGNSYPRHASLLDRDVQVGDIVHVRAVVSAVTYDLWTYVAGFVATPTASAIAAAAADANNAGSQSAGSATHTQTAGPVNCVDISAVSQTSYNGLPTGDINETYTITVTEGSSGGDFTTARLRVTSLSGRDDQVNVIPAASNSPTVIGTRGATVTFRYNAAGACSATAVSEQVSISDLVAGQTWQVTVHQAFTAPAATAGGTYTGTDDTTYIVTVTRGGRYVDALPPQITVSTTTGVDVSGPTNVTAASSNVAVGTKGVLVQFNQSALRGGDIYYIACTASVPGNVRTLVLGNNLDAAIPAGTDVDLTLYMARTLQVSDERTGYAPTLNWTGSDTEICVNSGMLAYEPSWTSSGVPQPLHVYSSSAHGYGKLYVTYRAWYQDLVGLVGSISDSGDLDTLIPGVLDPDNPLKYGVFKALQNANGTPVKYTAISDPVDPAGWIATLGLLEGRQDVYGLVPLTHDKTILDLYQAHVKSQSSASENDFRVLWTNLQNPASVPVVSATSSKDGLAVLAKLADDPQTSGTQYTLLSVPAGNGQFVTNGVRAGDVVRYLYTTDGFGNTSYTEFLVSSVVNQDQLLLAAGNSVAVSVAQKIEIWRNLKAEEQAARVAASAGAWADRRVRAVWPDVIGDGGQTVSGLFVCCALAGEVSGVVPHQGLTNLELAGFDDVSRTTKLFTRSQLDSMGGSGVWIVTQDPRTGRVYTRHALTTGAYADINQREEVITRNVDSQSFQFYDDFAPYIGIANATPSMLSTIRAQTLSTLQYLRNANYTPSLGGQLVDGSIAELYVSPVFLDTIVLKLNMQEPYPFNNLQTTLFI